MKFSQNWLNDYLTKKLPARKMADLLTMHSFQVESAEPKGDDLILDVDVLPNRAHDCFSHLGVAREAAALSGSALKIPQGASRKPAFKETKEKAAKRLKIEVREKALCPRYSARIMTDVKVGPSPEWLKERLAAIGQKSINNIVDIANFVMLELGQPLHAFDLEKLGGGKIVVRRAGKGEKIVTLDGDKYDLDEKILVIADAKNPVAIAGIKGGSGPAIENKTRTIVLESANFDGQGIRSASRRLNLRTDASMRFEQGIDPNLTEIALNCACFLIGKYAGGKALAGMIDVYPKRSLPKKIKLGIGKINSLAGFKFSLPQAVKILNSLDFKAKIVSKSAGEILAEVPTSRLDVELPEDLVEEICRVYGYENIPSRLPEAVLIPSVPNELVNLSDKVRTELVGQGFFEAYNYSFMGERDVRHLADASTALAELANPVSQDFKYLRDSLFAGLLKNVSRNLKNFKEIKIFEIGKVFHKGADPAARPGEFGLEPEPSQARLGISEHWRLSGVYSKKIPPKVSGELFYELKGALDRCLDGLGVAERWYDNANPTAEAQPKRIWDLAKSAEIKADGKEIGFIGDIRPGVLEDFDIASPVVAFDFDLENLLGLAETEREYAPIPKYPAVIRDIAILVNSETRIADILNVIYGAGVKYIEDVDLFDVYEGSELRDDKKSLAFHLIFQSPDHTLTDAEVNAQMEKILKVLRDELGAEIRK